MRERGGQTKRPLSSPFAIPHSLSFSLSLFLPLYYASRRYATAARQLSSTYSARAGCPFAAARAPVSCLCCTSPLP